MYVIHTWCVQIAELFESRVWCTALQASLLCRCSGDFFLCTTIYSENLCIRTAGTCSLVWVLHALCLFTRTANCQLVSQESRPTSAWYDLWKTRDLRQFDREWERADESTTESTDTCATIVKHYVIKTEVLLQNWISRSSDSQAHPYWVGRSWKTTKLAVKRHLVSVPWHCSFSCAERSGFEVPWSTSSYTTITMTIVHRVLLHTLVDDIPTLRA